MKKVFCIILTVLALLSLTACTPGNLPEVCFVLENSDIVSIPLEMSKWFGEPAADSTRPATVNVVINGNTLTGTYKNSQYNSLSPEKKHNYAAGEYESFSVDDSGKVIFYIKYNPAGGEAVEKAKAEEIARNFVKDLYPDVDLSGYTVSNNLDSSSGVYTVSFIKYAGERITIDHVSVNVAGGGEVTQFSAFMFGRITTDAFDGIDYGKLKTKLTAKCDTLLGKVKKDYDSVVYDDYQYILTLDEAGKPAVVTLVEIKLQTEHDSVVSAHTVDIGLYFTESVMK